MGVGRGRQPDPQVSYENVIDPVSVDGGHVSAYDHLRGAMRSFAVHRITGVSTVDEPTAS
mgnify:CR=1 FL=1